MEIVLYVYCFVVGVTIASFINVVVWRLPQQLNFVKGRSFCPVCQHPLQWRDLIPILSWLWLRGACRYCGNAISMRYPVVELIGGCLAMLSFACFGVSWQTLLVFAVFMILLCIALIDLDTMLIPDELQLALCIPIVLMIVLVPELSWTERLIGAFAVSLPMWGLTLLIPDCFGGGDIKLMFLCGLALGWKQILVAMFLAVLVAGAYAMYLLITKKAQRKDHIAFGPYLCFGIMAAFCFGNQLIDWYLSLLFI